MTLLPEEQQCLLPGGSHRGWGAQGGVGLVMRERPEGQIAESTHFHGPNMVIYEIISGA